MIDSMFSVLIEKILNLRKTLVQFIQEDQQELSMILYNEILCLIKDLEVLVKYEKEENETLFKARRKLQEGRMLMWEMSN